MLLEPLAYSIFKARIAKLVGVTTFPKLMLLEPLVLVLIYLGVLNV